MLIRTIQKEIIYNLPKTLTSLKNKAYFCCTIKSSPDPSYKGEEMPTIIQKDINSL